MTSAVYVMSLPLGKFLSRGRVPQACGRVCAGGCQHLAIRTEGKRVNHSPILFECWSLFSCTHVPEVDFSLLETTHAAPRQRRTIRAIRD
jgi:hypothetical protein